MNEMRERSSSSRRNASSAGEAKVRTGLPHSVCSASSGVLPTSARFIPPGAAPACSYSPSLSLKTALLQLSRGFLISSHPFQVWQLINQKSARASRIKSSPGSSCCFCLNFLSLKSVRSSERSVWLRVGALVGWSGWPAGLPSSPPLDRPWTRTERERVGEQRMGREGEYREVTPQVPFSLTVVTVDAHISAPSSFTLSPMSPKVCGPSWVCCISSDARTVRGDQRATKPATQTPVWPHFGVGRTWVAWTELFWTLCVGTDSDSSCSFNLCWCSNNNIWNFISSSADKVFNMMEEKKKSWIKSQLWPQKSSLKFGC